MYNKNIEQEEIYIRLINKSEDFIEKNLSKNISLSDLSENANFSQYHFHRIFKKYSNETVNDFITRFKLERVAIFISVNKDISLTDVALDYGYSDYSYFSKSFKKYFGCSPSIYRKEQERTSTFKKDMK